MKQTERPTLAVLLIDDDPLVARVVCRALDAESFTVTVTGSGAQALTALCGQRFDAVVADQALGDTEGSSVLQFARSHCPTTARLLLTAHPDVDVVIRAVNDGGVDLILRKPCEDEALRQGIRDSVQRVQTRRGSRSANVRANAAPSVRPEPVPVASASPLVSPPSAMAGPRAVPPPIPKAVAPSTATPPPARQPAASSRSPLGPTPAASPTAPVAEASPPQPADAPVAPNHRILVVEDDPQIRRFLDRTLRSAGYEVDAASSAAMAIEVMEEHDYVLALFDVNMPGESGLQLARRVRDGEGGARHRDLPIVFLTSDESLETYEATFDVSAYRLVQKPVDAHVLHGVLDGVLHAG